MVVHYDNGSQRYIACVRYADGSEEVSRRGRGRDRRSQAKRGRPPQKETLDFATAFEAHLCVNKKSHLCDASFVQCLSSFRDETLAVYTSDVSSSRALYASYIAASSCCLSWCTLCADMQQKALLGQFRSFETVVCPVIANRKVSVASYLRKRNYARERGRTRRSSRCGRNVPYRWLNLPNSVW